MDKEKPFSLEKSFPARIFCRFLPESLKSKVDGRSPGSLQLVWPSHSGCRTVA